MESVINSFKEFGRNAENTGLVLGYGIVRQREKVSVKKKI